MFDREVCSPGKSQVGFLKFVVAPTYALLGEFMGPQVQTKFSHGLRRNSHEREQIAESEDLAAASKAVGDLSSRVSLDDWDGFNVFELQERTGRALSDVFLEIARTLNCSRTLCTNEATIGNYIRAISAGYMSNSYHNSLH